MLKIYIYWIIFNMHVKLHAILTSGSAINDLKLEGVAKVRHISDVIIPMMYSCFKQQYSAASYCFERHLIQ